MNLEDLRIGCSGWSYKDWDGVFYPKGTAAKDYLSFYSKVFNCVEVDSSFYRVPSPFMVSQWRTNTPPGFLFCPKLPKKITHDSKLQGISSTLVYFYSVMSKLKEKLGPIAVQLPPSVKYDSHIGAMEKFLDQVSPEFKHAIEFRHKSWFRPEVYSMLRKNKVAMVWSINQYLETPTEVTSDFIYLRMVGDREISEFTGTQKDMSEEQARWSSAVKESAGKFESGYVFFNNHFAGFSPESTNEFRRLLGLMELSWKAQGTQQQTLFGP